MFLKPTAKPTPRRTPSPCVVFPAPPGSRSGSRGSSSGSGGSSAAAARIVSAIGTAPKPRIAPHGGLFEYTESDSISAFGVSYGPHANDAAFDVTAVELEA